MLHRYPHSVHGQRHNGTDGDVALTSSSHNIDSDHPMPMIDAGFSENYLAGSPALYGRISHGLFPALITTAYRDVLTLLQHKIHPHVKKKISTSNTAEEIFFIQVSTIHVLPNADSRTQKHIFRIL